MTDPAPYEDPNRALAEAREMQAAGKQEDAAQAATLLERVVTMVPDAANGWLELTRARHDLAQWDACVAAAERTLALDASCLEAELMRAVALLRSINMTRRRNRSSR